MTTRQNRRQFMALSAAAGFASPPEGRNTVRLGGPIFLKSDDPEALAQEHRKLGYAAAYCPAAKVEDTDRCKAIEKSVRIGGSCHCGSWGLGKYARPGPGEAPQES